MQEFGAIKRKTKILGTVIIDLPIPCTHIKSVIHTHKLFFTDIWIDTCCAQNEAYPLFDTLFLMGTGYQNVTHKNMQKKHDT